MPSTVARGDFGCGPVGIAKDCDDRARSVYVADGIEHREDVGLHPTARRDRPARGRERAHLFVRC